MTHIGGKISINHDIPPPNKHEKFNKFYHITLVKSMLWTCCNLKKGRTSPLPVATRPLLGPAFSVIVGRLFEQSGPPYSVGATPCGCPLIPGQAQGPAPTRHKTEKNHRGQPLRCRDGSPLRDKKTLLGQSVDPGPVPIHIFLKGVDDMLVLGFLEVLEPSLEKHPFCDRHLFLGRIIDFVLAVDHFV